MVKIIMHGCNGRMGQVITNLLKEDSEAKIVAGIDVSAHIENEYPVFSTISECTVDADVIIDFANVNAVESLLDYSVEKNVPVVLCTTGITEELQGKINKASEKVAVLKSANMSLGINLLMNLLKTAAQTLSPAGYDIEIVEKHHNQKLDAPSGTALALADSINEAMDNQFAYNYDRSKEMKAREKMEIGLSAVRGGTIVGEHEVIFAGIDEVIEFKHTAYSKAIFGKGAIQAAKYLAGKVPGYYGMDNVIEGNN